VSPDLLDQLRRASGAPSVDVPTGPAAAVYEFEDDTIYETPRGLLRTMRRLLNPVLKLLFNPEPLVMALHQQAQINVAAAAREADRVAQQAEWNALQYALVQRLVSEIAKLSLEAQHLSQQVESLSAKVDFSDRRVRNIEGGIYQAEVRSAPPPAPAPRAEGGFTATAQGSGVSDGGISGGSATGDGTRRKRRRRRGRRPGSPDQPAGGSVMAPMGAADDDGPDDDGIEDGPEAGGDGGETGIAVGGDADDSVSMGGGAPAIEAAVTNPADGEPDPGRYVFSTPPAEPPAAPPVAPAAGPDGTDPRDPVEP
ncbi:MAG: hypothetical protein AB7P99_21715, partial [Vicinamibacterales bacterium]